MNLLKFFFVFKSITVSISMSYTYSYEKKTFFLSSRGKLFFLGGAFNEGKIRRWEEKISAPSEADGAAEHTTRVF
ncbi:hypothetical protein PGB90_001906 [Kerria lacca]